MSGVNVFGFPCKTFNNWVNPPFQLIGDVIRHLNSFSATATLITPFWTSSSWWNLLAPDGVYFAEFVVDWTWLPREDPALLLPGKNGVHQRPHRPPTWHVLAIRVYFAARGTRMSPSERCTASGCPACCHALPRVAMPPLSPAQNSSTCKNIGINYGDPI
jgi:hypothetical protein